MLAKRVIPCLDVDRGRVVKGTNFVNLRDAGDPVQVAARYEAEGADELVFLDITASHEGRDIILDVVRRTAEQVFMPLTVGGVNVVVPREAVLEQGTERAVFVLDAENRALLRPVHVGAGTDRLAEIAEGLQPGEKVVVVGGRALRDGQSVVPVPLPIRPG